MLSPTLRFIAVRPKQPFQSVFILLYWCCMWSLCCFGQTNSNNSKLYCTDPTLELPTFLSGVKYAFLVIPPDEQSQIDRQQHSVLLTNFANYLRSIGFSGVGITTQEKMQLLVQAESYCDIAYVKVDMFVGDNYFTDHSIDITTCLGSEFHYTNKDTLYKDPYLVDKFFTVWKKMQRQKVPYYEANRLQLPAYPTKWTVESLDHYLKKEVDLLPIEGMYELIAEADMTQKARIAVIKQAAGGYDAIYIAGAENHKDWQVGEIIGQLLPNNNATIPTFAAKWVLANKTIDDKASVTVTDYELVVRSSDKKILQYRKLRPLQSLLPKMPNAPPASTGTGVLVSSLGYIVTNKHVVDGAKYVWVEINTANKQERYQAVVMKTDTINDLALLKIADRNMKGSLAMPFQLRTALADMGENVFTLGYPFTESMGDNVKLTTGVISSQTGFKGDVNTYQISAPVSPGNSGGPLFDNYGNLIGIIKSRHSKAENVTYSIKASVIYNFLLRQLPAESIIKTNADDTNTSLPELVKRLETYVFLIKVW